MGFEEALPRGRCGFPSILLVSRPSARVPGSGTSLLDVALEPNRHQLQGVADIKPPGRIPDGNLLLLVLIGFLRGQPINPGMPPALQTTSRNRNAPVHGASLRYHARRDLQGEAYRGKMRMIPDRPGYWTLLHCVCVADPLRGCRCAPVHVTPFHSAFACRPPWRGKPRRYKMPIAKPSAALRHRPCP